MIEIDTTPEYGWHESAKILAAYMARHRCYASPEETAEWLKTERGQRIKALLDEQRRKDKRRRPA